MHFDARAAKLLEPGGHLTFEAFPGLRLEATATRRTWTYRYRSPLDNALRQVKIGSWPAVSHARAVADWEDLRAMRDAGRCPATERREERAAERAQAQEVEEGPYTVRRLVEDYIAEHLQASRKPKGVAEMSRLLKAEIAPIEHQDATTVSRRQAFELLQAVAVRGPVVAGQLRGELGAAWDHALDAGRIEHDTPNWWRQILRGKLKSRGKKIAGESIGAGKRALSDQEVGKLINWLPNFSRLLHDVLIMYLWTCTRGAESCAILAEEVTQEPDGLWWTIPKAKTKNAGHELATDHRVPLVGRAEEVVRRRMAMHPTGPLFRAMLRDGRVEPIQQKTIQSTVYTHMPYAKAQEGRAPARLTVTHWSPHDLRRTGRTMLAALGCPREVGEVILGHILPGVEGTYNRHAYDKERREWLTRLDARLEELARLHRL